MPDRFRERRLRNVKDRLPRSLPLAWVTVLALVALLGPSVALAQGALGGKFRTGDQIVVARGETVGGDLYASAGRVRVEGTVDGDLVAAGGNVELSGEVTGDLIAGAGTVTISGRVGGDARIGAGQVTLDGTVGEDLVVGSGQVTISSTGRVGEDFVFGTGQTTLDGHVAGDVLGSTGSYDRGGSVGGTERVNIREPEETRPTLADRLLGALRRFLSLLIVGGLLLLLATRFMDGSTATLRRRPLQSLGVGAASLVGSILLAIVVVVVAVLLGIVFGLLGLEGLLGILIFATFAFLVVLIFLLLAIFAFVGPAIVALAIGRLVLRGDSGIARWAALVLGILVVALLSSVPAVGGVISFLIGLIGLGAVALFIRSWRRRGRDEVEVRPGAILPNG